MFGFRREESLATVAPKTLHGRAMKLHGSIEGNLISAIRSARRFRSRPVHSDTLGHWSHLLEHAGREVASGAAFPREPLKQLMAELETELAQRKG